LLQATKQLLGKISATLGEKQKRSVNSPFLLHCRKMEEFMLKSEEQTETKTLKDGLTH